MTYGEASPLKLGDWTGGRSLPTLGTNAGAAALPFQSWRRFKEAFAPELIEQAIRETTGSVRHIVDPFGGSGTTALAAQFLGVLPTTIEVNPFLADLIEAKIGCIDVDRAVTDWRSERTPKRTVSVLPVVSEWLADGALGTAKRSASPRSP